jgi:hypothetical protein
MGCDIHMHVEVKINNTWHHFSAQHVGRNYDLFDRLSNVRGNDYEGIARDRDIPEDASMITKLMYRRDGDDAHTPGYITSEEIKTFLPVWNSKTKQYESELPTFRNDDLDYFFGNGYQEWYEHVKGTGDSCIPEEVEDFRFVFWYDN